MTGETILLATINAGGRDTIGDSASSDVKATIQKIDPRFPSFLSVFATELALAPRELRTRCVAACLMFAATQLADDLADGDCNYLPDPHRTGPGTHWLLHQLFGQAVLSSTCDRSEIADIYRDLLIVGAAQQREVRGARGALVQAQQLAVGLNGHQYAAYFRLLASGSRWSAEAPKWGMTFGTVLHVVGDRLSRDERFCALSLEDRKQLVDWGKARLAELEGNPLVIVRRTAIWFAAVLDLPLNS
jgi:hypothetical protein